MCNDWDFDNLCAAHNGIVLGGAKEKVLAVIAKAEPMLQKLSDKNAKNEKDTQEGESGWGFDAKNGTECG